MFPNPFGISADTLALIKSQLPGLAGKEWLEKRGDIGDGRAIVFDKTDNGNMREGPRRAMFVEKTVSGNVGVGSPLGLLPYPLEAPAKLLYPILTPIRNMTPRRVVGGPALYWKSITAINTAGVWGSVPEATSVLTGRNSPIAYNEVDNTMAWKSFGEESWYTPEAQYGASSTLVPGQNFDAVEFATLSCLQATMRAEELIDLGGNVAALGTPAAVTTSTATTGGTLAAGTYRVRMSALTLQGHLFGSALGNGTPARGRSGGTDSTGETLASVAASRTTTGATSTITATGAALRGAVSYNWYIDDGAAGAYTWAANTTVANYTFLAPGTGNPPNAADTTANAYDYNGLIAQASLSGNNPYWVDFAGASLTGDNQFGVDALNTLFLTQWNTYKTGIDMLVMSASMRKKITTIVVGSTSPVFRIEAAQGSTQATDIKAGTFVGSVLNPYMGEDVPLMTDPDIPDGIILGLCRNLGRYYPNANIASNMEKMLRFDYQREDFAHVARKTEFGVYASGALVIRAPFTFATICNIATT